MIICIEGADGAGKMTQTTLLAEKLGGTRFAFPNYNSPTGYAILGHLKRSWQIGYDPDATRQPATADLEPLVFQTLQTINRFEVLSEINAALAKGPVIFDRYTPSALVYGGLDGLDVAWLEKINASLPQPDVYIYLDIPIAESFKRRPERRDRYESDRAYLEKVRDGYLKLFGGDDAWQQKASSDGGWWSKRVAWQAKPCWYIIDGLGTVEEVHERIMSVLK